MYVNLRDDDDDAGAASAAIFFVLVFIKLHYSGIILPGRSSEREMNKNETKPPAMLNNENVPIHYSLNHAEDEEINRKSTLRLFFLSFIALSLPLFRCPSVSI